MKFSLKTSVAIFLVGFIAFFCIRLGYGYVISPNGVKLHTRGGQFFNQKKFSAYNTGNIASLRRKNQSKLPVKGPISVDQRYEKIATMRVESNKFDDDRKKVRAAIKKHKALVQYEQSNGLKGSRSLQLALGVNPSSFDDAINDLKSLAKLKSLQVNKTDKTNEYKTLQASQVSLTKSRDALLALKKHDAKVAELIGLENRILEIEKQIQSLGVNLGEFDSEHEFVTIKLTLHEVAKPKLRNISLFKRSFTALVWAIQYYGILNIALMMFLIGAVCAVKMVEIFRRMVSQPNS